MTVPNAGPEHPDPHDPLAMDAARKGNPAAVHHDDRPTDDVQAASARASVVTHRFGGVRYALARPGQLGQPGQSGQPAWPVRPGTEDGDRDAGA